VPIFIPPIISAVVAMLLSREHAAPLAYVSGCLGTLIGADLLNFDELAHLRAARWAATPGPPRREEQQQPQVLP
jgi:uncharacterized membrane protein